MPSVRPGPEPTAARLRGRSPPSAASAARRCSRRRWTPRPWATSVVANRCSTSSRCWALEPIPRPRAGAASEMPMLYARDAVFGPDPPVPAHVADRGPRLVHDQATQGRGRLVGRRVHPSRPTPSPSRRAPHRRAARGARRPPPRAELTAEPALRRTAARRYRPRRAAAGAHRVVGGSGGSWGGSPAYPRPYRSRMPRSRCASAAARGSPDAGCQPWSGSRGCKYCPVLATDRSIEGAGRRRGTSRSTGRTARRTAPGAHPPRPRRRQPPRQSRWCGAGCARPARSAPSRTAGRSPRT